MKRAIPLLALLLAAPLVFAQNKPAAPAEQSVESAKSADRPITPLSISMPEFLARYDKFLALGEARAAAEKKRAEYDAAIRVMNEQLNERAAELRAQIPEGAVWDPAKRLFVRAPAPPAKSPENPPAAPQPAKPEGEKP